MHRPDTFSNELALFDVSSIAPRLTKRHEAAWNWTPELAKQYGVTERLKAENQMEWVRQMNACKAQAEEIVKAELIYD